MPINERLPADHPPAPARRYRLFMRILLVEDCAKTFLNFGL